MTRRYVAGVFAVLGVLYVGVASIGVASEGQLPGSFPLWMPLAVGVFWLLVAASLSVPGSLVWRIGAAVALAVGVAMAGFGVYGLGVLLPYWPCRAVATSFPEGYCASHGQIGIGVMLVMTGLLAVGGSVMAFGRVPGGRPDRGAPTRPRA